MTDAFVLTTFRLASAVLATILVNYITVSMALVERGLTRVESRWS